MRKAIAHRTQEISSAVVRTGTEKNTGDRSRRAFPYSRADPPACTLIIFLVRVLILPARLNLASDQYICMSSVLLHWISTIDRLMLKGVGVRFGGRGRPPPELKPGQR